MKNVSTLIPKILVYSLFVAALFVCVVFLPELAREEMVGKPKYLDITIPFLGASFILASPFFVALYQALKFLKLVDTNKAFTNDAISVLQNIKTCAGVFILFVLTAFVGGGIILRIANPLEDAPPFFMMGFILAFVAFVIFVAIAVLQKILVDATKLKSENDLII